MKKMIDEMKQVARKHGLVLSKTHDWDECPFSNVEFLTQIEVIFSIPSHHLKDSDKNKAEIEIIKYFISAIESDTAFRINFLRDKLRGLRGDHC